MGSRTLQTLGQDGPRVPDIERMAIGWVLAREETAALGRLLWTAVRVGKDSVVSRMS